MKTHSKKIVVLLFLVITTGAPQLLRATAPLPPDPLATEGLEPTSGLPPAKASPIDDEKTKESPSLLQRKLRQIDSFLKKADSKSERLRILARFARWTNKKIIHDTENLEEAELVELMQYSSILKALNLSALEDQSCKEASQKAKTLKFDPFVVPNPAVPKKISSWLKTLCNVKR